MTETLKAYRATKEPFSQKWVIQREYPCINGLSWWFTVATCHDACEQEMGYSDGAIGSAEQRANQIADALNTRPTSREGKLREALEQISRMKAFPDPATTLSMLSMARRIARSALSDKD